MKIVKFAALAAGLLMLGACSEDQTSFDVESVPGRCFIEGTVTYNAGTTIKDGHFEYAYTPAANLPITVTVSNSAYDPSLSGVSTFETVTDEEGKYSIEIPAPRQGVTAEITTACFRGTRTVIVKEDNKIVTKEEEVIYRGEDDAVVLGQGIVYANFNCTEFSVNHQLTGLTSLATLKGKIGQGVEYVVPAEAVYSEPLDEEITPVFLGYKDAELYYCYEGAPSVDLIIKVNYGSMSVNYNVTTDSKGNWTLQVPVESFPADFTYTVTALPYSKNYTRHEAVETVKEIDGIEYTYKEYKAHKLNGFYSQNDFSTYTATYPVSNQICDMESKMMVFSPLNDGQDLYDYTSSFYNQSRLWYEELIESLNPDKE